MSSYSPLPNRIEITSLAPSLIASVLTPLSSVILKFIVPAPLYLIVKIGPILSYTSVVLVDQSETVIRLEFNAVRSEEHTSELQSRENLVCRLLLEKKKINQ